MKNTTLYACALIIVGVAGLFSCQKSGSMILVPASASSSKKAFLIDPYEASLNGKNAASVTGRVPAVNIDFAEAKAACEASGKRLCTHSEWKDACMGPELLKYSVQEDFIADLSISEICDVARPPEAGALPSNTGSKKDCATRGLGVHDLVGNVTEWVVGEASMPVAAGVSFYQSEEDSHCESTLVRSGEKTMNPAEKSNDLGFRCCAEPSNQKVPTFPF